MEHDHQEGGTHRPQTVERCWGKQQGIAGQVMAVSGDGEWKEGGRMRVRESAVKGRGAWRRRGAPGEEEVVTHPPPTCLSLTNSALPVDGCQLLFNG